MSRYKKINKKKQLPHTNHLSHIARMQYYHINIIIKSKSPLDKRCNKMRSEFKLDDLSTTVVELQYVSLDLSDN